MESSSRFAAGLALVLFSVFGTQAHAAGTSAADTSLAAVENALGQIERSSRITEQIDLDAVLDRYGAEVQKNHDTTFQAVQEEAKKAVAAHGSTKVAAAKLQAWENQMAAHRVRMEKVVSRLTVINMKVRDGSILFAPELLKKLPKDELQELRQWLTPEAIRKYQALDRSLFALLPWDGRDFKQVVAEELSPPAGCPMCRPRSRSPLAFLDDLLASDAEAAIAAGCVAICGAQPEACVPCLIAAGFGADQLVKLLETELTFCNGRRTRLGRAVCKAAVILGFIATIA